jgi:hypothetical protein
MFCNCLEHFNRTWNLSNKGRLDLLQVTYVSQAGTITVTNDAWSRTARKLYASNINYFVTKFQLSVLSYAKDFPSFSSFDFGFDEDLVFQTLEYIAKHKRPELTEGGEKEKVAGFLDGSDNHPQTPDILNPGTNKYWSNLQRFCKHMNLCAAVKGDKTFYRFNSRLVQHEYRIRGLCAFWRLIRAYSVESENMQEDDDNMIESQRRLDASHVKVGHLEGKNVTGDRPAEADWRKERDAMKEGGGEWKGYNKHYKFLVPGSAMSTPSTSATADGPAGANEYLVGISSR